MQERDDRGQRKEECGRKMRKTSSKERKRKLNGKAEGGTKALQRQKRRREGAKLIRREDGRKEVRKKANERR